MDHIDEILGKFDLLDEIYARIMLRTLTPIKIEIPRPDKAPDGIYRKTTNEIVAHLRSHGARVYHGGFNSQVMTIYIKSTQERWVKYLLPMNGIEVGTKSTASRWEEKREKRRRR